MRKIDKSLLTACCQIENQASSWASFKASIRKYRQIFRIIAYNFSTWQKNPRIPITFFLAGILCFLLSEKIVSYAVEADTTLQIMEPFIWSFSDGPSILLASLLLVFLFADIPFLTGVTPFYLIRTDKKVWLAGQIGYICLATGMYLFFIVMITSLLCIRYAFSGNIWSPTAALLSYSGEGAQMAVFADVKAMEMSSPFGCGWEIFILISLYMTFLMSLSLWANLKKGKKGGMLSVFGMSIYGLLSNPKMIAFVLRIPEKQMYKANALVGWISPLNHATYSMHNFGYDLLPTIGQSVGMFLLLIFGCLYGAYKASKEYDFVTNT